MEEAMEHVLSPVMHDLRLAGVEWPPRFAESWLASDPDWLSVSLISPDGTDKAISVRRDWPTALMVAEAADQVQEWAIDELFPRAPTNWPRCPRHPQTHPLKASVVGAIAVWICPLDLIPVTRIGEMTQPQSAA